MFRVTLIHDNAVAAGALNLNMVFAFTLQAFAGEIGKLAGRHVPGTRGWLLDCFDEWNKGEADNEMQHRAFILSAEPGVGKSMLCALLCLQRKEAIAAHHFCNAGDVFKASPTQLLRSLAYQLALHLPSALLHVLERAVDEAGNIDTLGAPELFDLLLRQPLAAVPQAAVPGGQTVLLIDALDEARAVNGRNELLDLIRNEFDTLPPWVRFFITTRPTDDQRGVPPDARDLLTPLKKFNPKIWRFDKVGRLGCICVTNAGLQTLSDDLLLKHRVIVAIDWSC